MMDHHAKLRWARKHLETLQRDVDRFMDANPHEIEVRFDRKREHYVATLRAPKPLPRDWSLRIGDILHNTRSALDSMAYALAARQLGRTPSDDEGTQTRFVIVDEPSAWPHASARWLAHVGAEAREKIEALQPYHRLLVRYGHPLAVLRDLADIDRHRHIVLVAEALHAGGVPVEGPGLRPGTRVTGWRGRFVAGAEVPVLDVKDAAGRKIPAVQRAGLRACGHLRPEITFADGPPGHGGSVIGFVTVLHRHIAEEVFAALDPYLE